MKGQKILVMGWLMMGMTLVQAAPVPAVQELTVSAAASLTNAFQEIGQGFEQQHPGTKVILNFAGSGTLLQQIAQGAPVDVFASADQKTMDQAQERGLIVEAGRKNFVSNTLVLITPQDSKLALSGLPDLNSPTVKRVALGNPLSVPAGRYAQEALTKARLWEALQPKLIMGESVRQVLDYVSRGEVDAGLVFATDAAIAKGKVKTVFAVQGHHPIVYPAALVAAGRKKKVAQEFLNFLTGPEGMEILKKYGFGQP